MAASFILDPRLARESAFVGELDLSMVRLYHDANFPWLLMIPRRPDLREIIDLGAADRSLLMEEIAAVSTALRAITGCDKLNVAQLGNEVAQLHVHIIARSAGDAAWPRPVWGAVPARAYEDAARADLIARLRCEFDRGPAGGRQRR